MSLELPAFFQRLLDRFSSSRDFAISFALHATLIALFGGTVLYRAVQEPPDFEGEWGGFVQPTEASAPPTSQQPPPLETTFNVATLPPSVSSSQINTITTTAANPLNFAMDPIITAPITATPTAPAQPAVAPPAPGGAGSEGMSTAVAAQIKAFTGGWGKGQGSGVGPRSREFEFTAYIGQYNGGNWSSTVRISPGNKIETGSLPNLLYLMSAWSKDKIKTNYKNVQAIKLDSDEIFSVKPPFIFLTGTRDFKLTEKEVENLQKYVRLGGCIWGDSSLPGLRSRFDIAFKREMKRVIPDVDKNFEPLPSNHPIFTEAYFADVKEVPAGLNFYKEPVFAMKIYGEIAILYTANDYGDMWQVGLNQQGQIDLRTGADGHYVAINPSIYDRRDVYLRNIAPAALSTCFKFGTNVVIHLLTRWESKVRTAPTL
ncbi:MAG TPA: DUF4159 domain-containing protein [Terrimicrobiaceae bacterium]